MKPGPKPYSDSQRVALFWSRVKVGEPDECWEWQAARSPNGYGVTHWTGRSEQAHRIAFFLSGGYLPQGMQVCHACDNKPCCNPKHLFLGTPKENMLDAIHKDRLARGERNAEAKFTPDQIQQIRQDHSAGKSQRQLAKESGVYQSTIRRIVIRETWNHIK
jgi:hypothetical protein